MKTILLLIAAACLSSCTLTIDPSGSKTYTVDGEGFLRAVEVISQK